MARIGELIGPNGEVMHPKTSASVVYLEDGRSVEQVLSDDVDYGNVVFQDNSYKFDNDVEDDFAKTVIIKGQTYQNILPEPSTHVLTNNKEMFKVNEGLDPNVEIVDGVSESAILSGQTKLMDELGNECDHPNRPNAVMGAYINASTGEETLSDTSCRTTYIKAPHETFKIRGKNRWKKLAFYDVNKQLIKTLDPALNSYDDYVVDSTLIPSNAEYMRVSGSISPINSGDVLESVLEILDVNNSSLYNTQLRSCKLPVLTTTGKNLCDTSKYIHGGPSTDRKMIFSKDKYRSYYMKCKPSTVYTVKVENSNNRFGVASSHLFSEDTEFELNMCWFTSSSDVTGQTLQYTATTTEKDEYLYVYVANNGVFNPDIRVQVEEGSVATAYEPYKSNTLSTPEEVVLRSLPNGVKDTLNLMTGEYVQRIGEVILDGSDDEQWRVDTHLPNNYKYLIPLINGYYVQGRIITTVVSNKFPSINNGNDGGGGQDVESVCINGWAQGNLNLSISKTKLSNGTINELREYLSQNPITVQYQLATPVVKTVDLSSSGNWEKRALDGTETNWRIHNAGISTHTCFACELPNLLLQGMVICNEFKADNIWNVYEEKIMTHSTVRQLYLNLDNSRGITTVSKLKEYLSQNPITIWYQTQNHLDSTQVKQPIFFKDGHIIQSSGVDNSLIPTLDYQAKTSNSYVMDLMKTNTKYTMKAKSASGTFTIDGTSYGAGTNGTFTTPTSMTNKLLVMSNNANEEVMILEGDVTDKTIPYFKGIKSAFEDESKIEVLSTGKNLFDGAFEKGIIDVNGNLGYTPTAIRTVNYISVKPNASYHINLLNLEPFESARVVYVHEYDENLKVLGETQVDNRDIYTSKSATRFIKINTHNAHDLPVDSKMIVCESPTLDKQYEPYKSNNTKIPLLSPLRSLPNGVCDELIIDRMKKKATLIQRVGVDIYNGSETWDCYNESSSKTVEGYCHTVQNLGGGANNTNLLSNSFCANYRSIHNRDEEGVGSQQDAMYSNVRICISRTKLFPLGYTVGQNQVAYFQKWLQSNPVTVLYPLLTPVITEVDLEGFPYIYKDGHIFINSEIAPTVGIEYGINQGHRIEGQVETLQRHEQQFTKLERYFADLVHSDYNFALLRFSEKLRQQEGDV